MKNIPGTKHVCKDKTGFSVYKWINGKQKHLGHAKTLIMALMIRDWCIANNWKPYPGNMMKYIYQDKRTGHYQIIKQFSKNGKRIYSRYYGSFKTLEEAQEYRDLCVEKDWDEQLMPCNNPTVINPLKYIQKTPAGNYRIGKWENGKSVHYGTYLTLFDAIQERDLLIKYNWNYDLLCEHDERLADTAIFNGRVMGD